MKPERIEVIGVELAIQWEDGGESYIPLETLRRRCPCAGCQGERDVMGHLHKGPEQKLNASSFVLKQVARVGTYAICPQWADGHHTGIFSFDYLRRIAPEAV